MMDLNTQLWIVRLGSDLIGPMTHEEVTVGLQKGRWTYQDFVKKHGEVKWSAIESVHHFYPDFIKTKGSGLFIHRNHVRFHHQQWVLLHNQNELIKGVTFEVGQGGLGVMVDYVPKYWLRDWMVHIPSSEHGSSVAFNMPCKMVGYRTQPQRLICFQKMDDKQKDVDGLWSELLKKIKKDAA